MKKWGGNLSRPAPRMKKLPDNRIFVVKIRIPVPATVFFFEIGDARAGNRFLRNKNSVASVGNAFYGMNIPLHTSATPFTE
jgi:hypothetical protein